MCASEGKHRTQKKCNVVTIPDHHIIMIPYYHITPAIAPSIPCHVHTPQGMILAVFEAVIPSELGQEERREEQAPSQAPTDPGRPLEVGHWVRVGGRVGASRGALASAGRRSANQLYNVCAVKCMHWQATAAAAVFTQQACGFSPLPLLL